ncbi:MAG: hypothetical protein ILP10_06025 [Lachnospiraceae bacterium]|nr:hypothetical protein [Lachnospiraceae bacterium]
MPISGYIIEKYNNMTGAYTCNRLLEEGRKLGMRLDLVGVYDTFVAQDGVYNVGAAFGAGSATAARKLERRDFCVWRYKPGAIKREIAALADRSYNRQDAFEKYMSKYEQLKDIGSKAFRKPRFMLAKTDVPYEAVASRLDGRFVAKGLTSSMGREVFLVENEERYRALLQGFEPEKEWLFEEYIETSAGRDLRIYAVRGEAVACMERKSRGDFRANVALGAETKALPVTDEIRLAAKDIYEITGLDFAGIDLLFDRDGLCFCEVNITPGIEGIESASGVNIAGIVMETVRDDMLAARGQQE